MSEPISLKPGEQVRGRVEPVHQCGLVGPEPLDDFCTPTCAAPPERPEGGAALEKCWTCGGTPNPGGLKCVCDDTGLHVTEVQNMREMLLGFRERPEGKAAAREEAERIVDAWEAEEGESMREGHRHTFVRLISAALSDLRERGEQVAKRLGQRRMNCRCDGEECASCRSDDAALAAWRGAAKGGDQT